MENEKKSIFALHRRKFVCENGKFKVFFDDVKGKDGEHVKDYLVVVPKLNTGNFITGIAILPVMKGKIGLIRVYRHPIQDYSWEIPRGFLDENESPIAASLRELEEETGLRCKLEEIHSLGYATPEPGVLNARVELFVAPNCVEFKPYQAEEFGHEELNFFTQDEILNMANSSLIQDPCTLISFYRWKHIDEIKY
jgi:8-oxo-dGTP pyrophosphatase MutT (NUDIX family)